MIAIGVGPSEDRAMRCLQDALDEFLSTEAAPWLETLQYARAEDTPNCPEGSIKLPIDLWYCKLVREVCPIQAQVFLDDRTAFLEGCLADEERKVSIYEALREGKYGGFHHVVGRGPCTDCEVERGSDRSSTYYYPWELSRLEDFAPFVPERDMEMVMRVASRTKVRRPSVLGPLCARHSVEAAELLYPEVATSLRIVERGVYRPAPRTKQSQSGA